MVRRSLAVCCSALPLAVVIWLAGQQRRAADAAPDPVPPAAAENEFPHFVVFPYLQYATPDSVTLLWETSFPGTSVVRHGIGKPSSRLEGEKSATLHEVTLRGLKPGTGYVYEVSTVGEKATLKTPLLTFQTVAGPDEAFSFVLIGDTQKNPTVTARIAALAWQRRPNFVVHLGDVVDQGPDRREWVNELFAPCKDLFCRVPVYPCIGNHEKNHANYYRYFSLPAPEYHYRYRYGNADFFVLDTNRRVDAASEQYRWLDAELAKSDAKWKFVYHHHPAYTSDSDDYGKTFNGEPSRQGDANVRNLVPLYEKHGVDVVFNGHIHVYERTWPIRGGKVDREKGVTYLTSGGGGGKLEDFAPVPAWFKAQHRSEYHFTHITIHGGRLSLRAIDHQGMLFDTWEVDRK